MIYLSLAYSVASFWYLVEMSGPEDSVAVILKPQLLLTLALQKNTDVNGCFFFTQSLHIQLQIDYLRKLLPLLLYLWFDDELTIFTVF